ncbi:MAG: hypothetical protein IVW57_19365, partial [Ktedonobacterales bacterium]|nr:hypothetical protein [Ktedonobacterales bacterium]
DATWPAEVPILGPVAGAALLFAFVQLTAVAAIHLAPAFGRSDAAIQPLSTVTQLVVCVVGLTLGLALVARGRANPQRRAGGVGLFLTLVALLVTALDLPLFLVTLGALPPDQALQPGLATIKVVAALGTLALVIWLAASRRLGTADARRPLVLAFVLLIGLQTLTWVLNNLLPTLAAASAQSTVAAAILFLAAVSWGLATSGESATNADTPTYPREGRVLLYLAYTLVASSTLLYTASRRLTTGQSLPSGLSDQDLSLVGLVGLAAPFVVFGFVVGIGRWRAARVAVPPQPALVTREAALPGVAIFGGGFVALALVALLTPGSILPRQPLATQGAAPTPTPAPRALSAYSAAAPGPAPCDTAG